MGETIYWLNASSTKRILKNTAIGISEPNSITLLFILVIIIIIIVMLQSWRNLPSAVSSCIRSSSISSGKVSTRRTFHYTPSSYAKVLLTDGVDEVGI